MQAPPMPLAQSLLCRRAALDPDYERIRQHSHDADAFLSASFTTKPNPHVPSFTLHFTHTPVRPPPQLCASKSPRKSRPRKGNPNSNHHEDRTPPPSSNMHATSTPSVYPMPAAVPDLTTTASATTSTTTSTTSSDTPSSCPCTPTYASSASPNDQDSLSPSCCPVPPLATFENFGMLRGPSSCSTCSTITNMSSAISVASSVSDEDEVRHHDDLVDEEAAGHGKDPRDENHKYRLKLLNFNVFAGSPVPVLFRSLLPKTESLEGSVRLKLQVERIKAMGPDIICLQEACSDGVERYYREAFSEFYDSFYDAQAPEPAGKALLFFIYLLLSSFLAFCFHCLLDLWASSSFSSSSSSPSSLSSSSFSLWATGSQQDDSSHLLLALVLVCKAYIIVTWSMHKSCLVGFLQGNIKASTVILWRKDRFSVVCEKDPETKKLVPVEMRTTFFQEQRGDWLNLVRPRGYLTARLLFNGMPLYVVNTHLNLGEQGYRRRQVEELTRHCEVLGEEGSVVLCGDFNVTPESEEIQLLCRRAGVRDALEEKGCVEATWSSRNPLTHGVLREGDHRCDFIFYKGGGGHRMVNRRCRLDVPFWGNAWLSDHFGIVLDLVLEPLMT